MCGGGGYNPVSVSVNGVGLLRAFPRFDKENRLKVIG